MEKISVTLRSDQVGEISDLVGDEYDSRSEAVRDLVDKGLEYAELETENERLRSEKETLIRDREEHQELVEYVEGERSWREQPLTTRVRWWLFGQE
jgi:Arc/MetJ-type ribon-helix-helix transcriptional regulator